MYAKLPWYKAAMARTRVHFYQTSDVRYLGVMQLWQEQWFIVYETSDVRYLGVKQL